VSSSTAPRRRRQRRLNRVLGDPAAPVQLRGNSQPVLHCLFIRLPGALNPRLDLAPLNLVRCRGPFHRHHEPRVRPRRVLRESAPPELRDGERRRFVQRARGHFYGVPDVVCVGERDEAGVRGGHEDIVVQWRTKSENP